MAKPEKDKPADEGTIALIGVLKDVLRDHFASDKETLAAVLAAIDRLETKQIERFKIMAEAISSFAARVNTSFDKIGASVDGLVGDVDTLKKKIEELQNSSGSITPEDQALLDAIEARANTVGDKLAALDAATENAPAPNP